MKGDFTRSTFRSNKHYSSVRMQQGRLQVDADWNEQADISAYLREAQALDMLVAEPASQAKEALLLRGSSENRATMAAAPRTQPEGDSADVFENFRLDPRQIEGAHDVAIAPGHIYVDGILCELTEPLSYLKQSDYPNAKAADLDGDGSYLAYLDVWQRHITALDDIEIRERALTSVPDTATRIKTVWQVKLQKLSSDELTISLDGAISELKDKDLKKGQLTVTESEKSNGFGQRDDQNGRSLGNSLYRVEIHDSGPYGIATFKWSKNNGIVVAKISDIVNNTITINNLAPDEVNRFSSGDWVEVIDTIHELRGEPGLLLRLSDRTTNSKLVFDPATLIAAKDNPVTLDGFQKGDTQNIYKVRRWEEVARATDDAQLPIALDGSSVQINFKDDPERAYNTGDYWLIPMRSGRPDLPQLQDKDSVDLSPEGVRHSKAPLALLYYQQVTDDNQLPTFRLLKTQAEADRNDEAEAKGDYRLTFPALTRCLDSFGSVIQGSFEVQKNLLVTQSRDEENNLVYGRLGVGTYAPKARIHVVLDAENSQKTEDLQQWHSIIEKKVQPVAAVDAKGNLNLGLSTVNNPELRDSLPGQIKLFNPQNQSFHGALSTVPVNDKQQLTFSLSDRTAQFVFKEGDLRAEQNLFVDKTIRANQAIFGTVSPTELTPEAHVHIDMTNLARVGQIIKATSAQGKDLQQWQGVNNHRMAINTQGFLGLGVDNPDVPLAVSDKIKLFDPDLRTINAQSFHGAIAFNNREFTLTAHAPDQPLALTLSQSEKQFKFSGGMLNIENSVPEGETQCLISGKLAVEALALGDSATVTQISTESLTNSAVALSTDKVVKNYVDETIESVQEGLAQLDSAFQAEKKLTTNRFESTKQTITKNAEAITKNAEAITKNAEAVASNAAKIKTLSDETINTLREDVNKVGQDIESISQTINGGTTPPAQSSIQGRLNDIEDSLSGENTQSFVSQSVLTSGLLTKANLTGSSDHDFTVKNLIANNNLLLQAGAPSEQTIQTAARLQAQGLGESPFVVAGDILPSRNEMMTLEPLAVGDSIILTSGDTKLVTAVEDIGTESENTRSTQKVTLSPSFPVEPADRDSDGSFNFRRQSPIARFTDSTGIDQLTLTAQGNVVIGPILPESSPATDAKLHVDGKVFGIEVVTQSMAQLSSHRLKENISALSTDEATVLLGQLDPVKFSYRTDENHATRTGFIAETVPDMVATTDHQAISPLDITAILTKVLKDHHLTLANMSAVIQQQQNEIRALNATVARLSQ